ncbi:prepilin-type N-terminal cleavage/methylation domain-containing protein [Patescibacteria group bacterium]|nr:prepilin-type N-terminal cleavage/methylation domain-containing protein [Patescibacteria group bacterium]
MAGNNKGYTLVEMLVVVLVFSVVVGSATSVFVSVIKIQKYNLSHQQLLSQTSYAAEFMSRSIRMARKDSIGCIDGSNYQETVSSIKFATYHNECWEFYLDNGMLKMDKDGTVYDLTSDDFTVNSFVISVTGDGADLEQPKVTISLEVVGNISISSKPKINIQTTISQRNLDL